MEEQLIKILSKAFEVVSKTGEFVLDQAPLLIQEFYKWSLTKHIFYILLGFCLLVLGNRIKSFVGSKHPIEGGIMFRGFYYSRDNANLVGLRETISVMSFLVFLIVVGVHVYHLLLLIVSPKIYLLNYLISNS